MPALLVTGGLGFIGAAYVNAACERIASGEERDFDRVVVLDCLSYAGDEDRLRPEAKPFVAVVRANLRSWSRINRLLKDFDVLDIVHFAAYSHVSASFEAPGEFVEDNILGTQTLLECARMHAPRLRRFVHISTDEVYGQSATCADARAFCEDDALAPTNPYSASKACAEILARTYWRCFDVPVVVTRGNNCFGPGQHSEKLIPAFMQAVADGRRMRVEGSGNQRRSFLFSSDVARAVELVRRNGVLGEVYNIGADCEHTVLEIAQAVLQMRRPGERLEDWVEFVRDRPFNDQRYFVDSGKLRALGWTQTVDLAEGLLSIEPR